MDDKTSATVARGATPRQRCWNSAFNAFATAELFRNRVARLSAQVRLLAFSGYVLPVVVGAFVLGFGPSNPELTRLLWLTAVIGVAQALVSSWALNSDWSGNLSRCNERVWVNHDLSSRFKSLGEAPPGDESEFQRAFDRLSAEEQISERTDYQMGIAAWELRAGYRAASRQFQRRCATCKQVAVSLEPASDCATCGEPNRFFSKRASWKDLAAGTPIGDTKAESAEAGTVK